jgi:hypothetical protein
MARLMVPSTPATRGEVDLADTQEAFAGPDGRFYVPSGDAKAEKQRPTNAMDQAALVAAPPPTKEEVREAKKEQVAAEKAAASPATEPETPADPAAETTVESPVEAASATAANPPPETANQPGSNASRGAWAEYAKTRGATDEDLLDSDGNPLGRNALRDKYALI